MTTAAPVSWACPKCGHLVTTYAPGVVWVRCPCGRRAKKESARG